MDINTAVILVTNVAIFIVALIALTVKLIELSRK